MNILKQNDFLIKFVQQNIFHTSETLKTKFLFDELNFYNICRKFTSSENIDKLKETLLEKSIFLHTKNKNTENNLLSFELKYEPFSEQFVFTLLPTESEIENFNEREILRQKFFEEELIERILGLNSYQ